MNHKTVSARIPVTVIGGPAPVEPPTSHGPLSPPGDVNDYERADIVKEAARRSTEQGGTLLQRAAEIAKERGKTFPTNFEPLGGL